MPPTNVTAEKPAPYINHNAIHEAGHVIAALCFRLDVTAVLIKPTLKYAARCTFNPTRTIPMAVYGMKIAGSIAVEIQNERCGRTDDTGFGLETDPESDAATVSLLGDFWRHLGMTDEKVKNFDREMRLSVRKGLIDHWNTLEAIAREVARLTPSSAPLTASKLSDIIQRSEPAFFEQVKAQLPASS
jgi:hypothetical protein